MASSIAQPGGSFNGSNFVEPADDIAEYESESHMEDAARGSVPPPLDRGAVKVS